MTAGEVSVGAVARPLVVTMLAPVAAGMIARRWARGRAAVVIAWLGRIANTSLVLVVTLGLALNLETVRGVFGTGAIASGLLFTIGAYGVGWLVGAFGDSVRDDVGLITAQRNFSAALVVAADSFSDDRILVMVVVLSLLSFVVLIPGAKWLGKRQAHAEPNASAHESHGHRSAA
jgi:BASS family bile acid:Na+ symporter